MKDIALYIQSCTTCQRVNNRMERPAHSLHPTEVNSPWHRIGIDLIGPLPLTTSGNSYIVTCSDYFTKWPEAAAIPDKSGSYCGQISVPADHKAWQPNYNSVRSGARICESGISHLS